MKSSKDKILIIGGYGAVGSVISTDLARDFPQKVIIAGRDSSKAQELIEREKLQATPAQIDIRWPKMAKVDFHKIHTAICCVEIPGHTAMLEICIAAQVNYLEIGTSWESFEKFFSFKNQISEAGICAIPNVGLLPGLSNVFAYRSLEYFAEIYEVQTYLMLGLGDKHGLDAIRWMLAYSNRNFILRNQKDNRLRKSLSEPKKTRFLHETNTRTFYLFDFADQHSIPLTTGAKKAETRLAFDSRWATRLMHLSKGIGFMQLAEKWNPKKIKNLLDKFKAGSNDFALQVEISGQHTNGKTELKLLAYGQNEAYITGVIGAYAVRQVVDESVKFGLCPIEKSLPFKKLVNDLSNKGLSFKASDHNIFEFEL